MRCRLLSTCGCAVLGACLVIPSFSSMNAYAQQSTGPIRQGVRSAAQGTAQAARRAGEATRNVIGGAADAARNLGPGNRATNQTYQGQYDQSYQGQYDTGYRGIQQTGGFANTGRVYQLRYDASGREFICVCGQRVYFDNQAQPHQTAKPVMDDMQSSQDARSGQAGDQASPPPPPTPSDQPSDAGNQSSANQQGSADEVNSPQQTDAQNQSSSDAPSLPQNDTNNADLGQGSAENAPDAPAEPATPENSGQ